MRIDFLTNYYFDVKLCSYKNINMTFTSGDRVS